MAKEKSKSYLEAELIDTFQLIRLVKVQTPRMLDWHTVEPPVFSVGEQFMFDSLYDKAVDSIAGWSE